MYVPDRQRLRRWTDTRTDTRTDPLGSGSLRRKPHSAPRLTSRSAGSGWEDSCCVQGPSDISVSVVTTPVGLQHVVKQKVLKSLLEENELAENVFLKDDLKIVKGEQLSVNSMAN